MDNDNTADAVERVRAWVAAYTSMLGMSHDVHQAGVKGELFDLTIADLKTLVLAVDPQADLSPMTRRGLDAKRPEIDWGAAHRAESASITRGRRSRSSER